MFGCKDKLTPKSHADKCLVSIPILLRPYTSFLVSMLRNQRLFGLSSLPLSHPIAATPPDDSSLVKLAMTGDQAAFEDLMRLHHERTFRLVYSVVRHEQDARDVCQEVWLTVWKQLPQFRGDARCIPSRCDDHSIICANVNAGMIGSCHSPKAMKTIPPTLNPSLPLRRNGTMLATSASPKCAARSTLSHPNNAPCSPFGKSKASPMRKLPRRSKSPLAL